MRMSVKSLIAGLAFTAAACVSSPAPKTGAPPPPESAASPESNRVQFQQCIQDNEGTETAFKSVEELCQEQSVPATPQKGAESS